MKTKRTSTRLTAAAVEAFREEKHRDRVALADRVRRGELTAAQANDEASIFRGCDFSTVRIDWTQTFADLKKLHTYGGNCRKRKKAVRS